MIVLLDIGNSRVKWACSENGELTHHGAAPRDEKIFETLATACQMIKPLRIIASNVAGEAFGQQLQAWSQNQWGISVEYVAVEQGLDGLEIAYEQPQLFGIDRWIALIAARRLYPTAPICVIDCGTAVTIDAVDASGKHLGGLIVPGIELMQKSLLQRAGGISRGVETPSTTHHTLLGCNTRSGIEQGALYAVAGAITHAHAKIKAQVATPITSLVTGGDAKAVLAEIGGDYQDAPNLLLQGLQILIDR